MHRRVVVTGVGLISPLSESALGTFLSVCNSEIGLSEIPESSYPDFSDLPIKIGGLLPASFDLSSQLAQCGVFKTQFNALSLFTSRSALLDSNYSPATAEDSFRTGVIFGCDKSSPFLVKASMEKVQEQGYSGLDRFFLPKLMVAQSIGTIGMACNVKGYTNAVSAGYSTGQVAVSDAFRAIRLDHADVMIAGASELEFESSLVMSLYKAGLLARSNEIEACKPFDINSDGMVCSVGAGALVLEELSHALGRNARIYAEVVAAVNIANPDTRGECKGPERAMELVVAKAGIDSNEVNVVMADACGLNKWDLTEANAIEKLFPEAAVTSVKGSLGHMMSASGICQSVLSALIVSQQSVPPITNLIIPVNETLNYVIKKPLKTQVKYAVSNSFTYEGGCFSSILFKRYTKS